MSNETDLDWLVRVTGGIIEPWCEFIARSGLDSWACTRVFDLERCWFTREQYLARRAELQNKPSFADHPDAKCLVQMPWGGWFKNKSDVTLERRGEKATLDSCGAFEFIRSGEVLGDWRDTLERRPVDLSEPAGGVKGRGADGAEEINAMAQRLLVALKSEPRSFDTGALAEMVELADAEIVKRDAKVCGGEGYLNNHWFERGELPPVGIAVQLWHGGTYAYDCELIAKRGNDFVLWNLTWDRPDSADCMMCEFKPTPTEREVLADLIESHGQMSALVVADAILAAGFSLGAK